MDPKKPNSSDEEPESDTTQNLSEELYGSDEIGIEVNEGKKLEFGFSFSAQDGESGNETEDFGDLPTELKKPGHVYNPALSSGSKIKTKDHDEITDSMHISGIEDAGISFSEDSYEDKD